MDNESQNIKNEKYLPSFLINDIEFDELDKEMESKEKKEDNGFNSQYAIKKYNFNILVFKRIQKKISLYFKLIKKKKFRLMIIILIL